MEVVRVRKRNAETWTMNASLEKPYNDNCPKCNTPQAYVSLLHAECVNEHCSDFSESHLQVVVDYESTMESLATVHDEKTQWVKRVDDEELDEFAAFFDSWSKIVFP